MNPIKISNMNAIESQLQLYFDGLSIRRKTLPFRAEM